MTSILKCLIAVKNHRTEIGSVTRAIAGRWISKSTHTSTHLLDELKYHFCRLESRLRECLADVAQIDNCTTLERVRKTNNSAI